MVGELEKVPLRALALRDQKAQKFLLLPLIDSMINPTKLLQEVAEGVSFFRSIEEAVKTN